MLLRPLFALAALIWSFAPAPAAGIDALEDIQIGGMRQKILILGDDASKPILLWLHGGPGEPAMMISHYFSGTLRKHFIVVHWDQPGAGLSFDPAHPPTALSEARIERDALELIDRLLKRFGRKKLYVIGHSFGSIIGTRLAARHPDRFCAYVGMGQVVNDERSFEITRAWLKAEMTKAGDAEGLERLAKAGRADIFTMIRARGGVLHTKIDYMGIVKTSPYYFDGYWEMKQKAKAETVRLLGASVGGIKGSVPPERIRVLKVPAFYFEGRYDRIPATAPELVVEYVGKLKAPYKEIVWFENSGHLPNLDEPQAFQNALIDKVLTKTKGCGGS